MNPTQIKISVFPNIKTPSNGKEINLHQWMTNKYYEPTQTKIRACKSEPEQKFLKATLPAATMSGVCTYRKAENLQHNGFICIDVDLQDNPLLLSSPDIIKAKIYSLPFVYLCAESVRGGLYCLVQIADPTKHKEYYSQLAKEFQAIGINVDAACSDTARARIYSHDDNYFLNVDATIYNKIPKPEPKQIHATIKHTISTNTLFDRCLEQIERYSIDITAESRKDWIKIASGIASEFGSGGLEYFKRISCYYPDYKPNEAERTYNNILKNPRCTISSFFNICKQYNISYLK